MLLYVAVILALNAIQENFAQYTPPTPTIEPLYPKGIRLSIPHEDGISLVAYHVNINEEFINGLEAGTIAVDITKMRNGRWTYEDRKTRLKRGDIIYYWVHVVYDGLGYNLLDKEYIVNDFYNYDGTPVGEGATGHIGCAVPSDTKIFVKTSESQVLTQRNVCSGELIFQEEFDTLNTSRWMIVEQFAEAPDYEFVVYMNSNDVVDTNEGILNIKPMLTNNKYGNDFVLRETLILERCTGEIGTSDCKQSGTGAQILPPIISGRLNTKPSFIFLYGRVQIRAKLPRGDWIHPLITLENTDKRTDNTTVYCNIIIAHANGNPSLQTQDGRDLSGRVLLSGGHAIRLSNPHQDNRLSLPSKKSNLPWSDSYHLYEIEWKHGRIMVKVDGEQYGEQTVPSLYDKPVYLNVGVAVGGHNVYPDRCISGDYEKPWRNKGVKALYHFHCAENNWLESWKQSDTGLHIDYIKVWAI